MTEKRHLNIGEAALLRAAINVTDRRQDHLSDEEFVDRAFDDVSAEARVRIDAHLATCQMCSDEVDRMRAVAADMNSEQRRSQIDRLWEGFKAASGTQHRFRELLAGFWQIVAPTPRLAPRGGSMPLTQPAGRVLAEGEVADGQIRWQFTEHTGSTLKVTIVCSAARQLRGACISLNTKPARSLELVESGDEVKAEFEISREDWRQLQDGPIIERIVFADGEVVTPDTESQ